jgi:hypothetical protein
MRVPLTFLLTASVFVLAGCNPGTPARDRAYFAGHPGERAQALAACQRDPGKLSGTPNCANASQADAAAEHERVFHGPPPKAPGVNNPGHL